MPYGQLLKKLAKDKKMTYKKIANACSELGEPLSDSYIKEVANNRKSPPSERKSRAIAKALSVNENLLILEGYIDKAPLEIKRLLNNIRKLISLAGLTSIENELTKDEYSQIEKEMEKQNLAEFFVDLLEEEKINYINNKNFDITRQDIKFSINYNNISFLNMTDNSMEPKIEKGSNITVEIKDKYINGEIVVAKIKGENKIVYRIVYFGNGTITLTPFNDKEYKTITYNREDVEIIGKVAKVIKEL